LHKSLAWHDQLLTEIYYLCVSKRDVRERKGHLSKGHPDVGKELA